MKALKFLIYVSANFRYVHNLRLASGNISCIGMDKSKFNQNWLDNPDFALWLKPVQGTQDNTLYAVQEVLQTR